MSLLAPVGGMVIGAEFGVDQVCGPSDCSFQVMLGARQRPDWLAKDAPAFVSYGARRILNGTVSEVDWDDKTITILGHPHAADTAACLSSAGETTSTPDDAVDQGIARGALPWSRPASLSTVALTDGDETTALNTISELLAAWSSSAGRPTVDSTGNLVSVADPTTPGIFLLPGIGELSWASESQATRLIGRWQDVSGKLSNTMVGSGSIEQLVDLTALGPIDSAHATATLADMLADLTAGGWAGGLTVTSEQIYGGLPLAHVLEMAGRGLMVRSLGQRDPRPGVSAAFVDFVVERAEWHVDDGQIILTPRGMVARDLSAVLADYGAEAA